MKRDWKEWRIDQRTLDWFEALEQEELDPRRDHLGRGGSLKATVDETALETARLAGVMQGLEIALMFRPKWEREEGEEE